VVHQIAGVRLDAELALLLSRLARLRVGHSRGLEHGTRSTPLRSLSVLCPARNMVQLHRSYGLTRIAADSSQR